MLIAWILTYIESTGLKGCKVGKDCLGADGVLRVSMGCFVSFVKISIFIICMKSGC